MLFSPCRVRSITTCVPIANVRLAICSRRTSTNISLSSPTSRPSPPSRTTSTPPRLFSTAPPLQLAMPVSDRSSPSPPPAKRARTDGEGAEAAVPQPPNGAAHTPSTSTAAPKVDEEYTGAADSASYVPTTSDTATAPGSSSAAAEGTTSSSEPKPWENLDASPLPESTSPVDFRKGLFLAPMVRSGSLPTRLMSLEYGADLVWGPEIVDRAIMGCERVVDARTGTVDYVKDGKAIFSTHPIERPYVIFQLGSANVEWAYHATKLITANNDVAGVDLNCGCPKPFSTIGGMGANLLSTPDLLCDILKVMRKTAPPHVSVSCKIRLLPTKEETQSLVRKIIKTGAIDNLTVHCRTKTMRPREPALPERLEEVKEVVQEMTGGKLPLCINGDGWDAKEAHRLMELTGVTSVMMARGAEANASCFRLEGNVSNPSVMMPRWVRIAMAVNNVFGNSKYCLGAMCLKASSSIRPNARPAPDAAPKSETLRIKQEMAKAKDYESLGKVFGVDYDVVKSEDINVTLRPLREALEKRQRAGEKDHVDVEGKEAEKGKEAIMIVEQPVDAPQQAAAA